MPDDPAGIDPAKPIGGARDTDSQRDDSQPVDSHSADPKDNDSIVRFHFEELALRGAVVKLSNSFVEALNGRDYPGAVRDLLGECLAATLLMSTNLKRSTRLSVQARGQGPLRMLMAETCTQVPLAGSIDAPAARQTVRALARLQTDSADGAAFEQLERAQPGLQSLLGKAQLAITVEPIAADLPATSQQPPVGKRYQGIVELDQARLDRCLEQYFLRSEQLPTFIKLCARGEHAAGLLIQKIPAQAAADRLQQVADASWQEITVLASSLQADELLELPAAACLHRLFHAHQYQLAAAQPVTFACSCSTSRTGAALMHIDPTEIEAILAEDGEIVMDCEFCSARYRYDRAAIDLLSARQPDTRH